MNDSQPRASSPGPVRPPGPGEPGRVQWLFRDAARERRIHPLMRLIEDYRRHAGKEPRC